MNRQSFHFKKAMLLLATVAMFSVSCKKYIYDAPINSTYGAEFWTSQSSVEQATLAMYGQLRSSFRSDAYDGGASYFINGDLAAGTFLPRKDNPNLQLVASSSPAFNFSSVVYREFDLQNWSRFYQVIAQANLILQNVPLMSSSMFTSEAVRKGYLAEALFVRAYTYFYITRVWGDPVYVTRTYNGSDYGNIAPLPRTPEVKVLDSCIRDLKIAAGYMNYAGGDFTKSIRGNKGSNYALTAHIYEWLHQYDSAHTYCQKVIQNGGYALEPMASYSNIWKGQSSAESIFELPMTYNANDPNFTNATDWAEANFDFFGIFLKGPITGNQRNNCWVAPAGGLVDNTLYDTANDARFKTVFTTAPNSGGDAAGYLMTKYSNFAFQQPGTLPNTGTNPYISNDLVLFRLSDIILLDAEARAYKGDVAGAQALLALTEGRAGISSYQGINNQNDITDEVVLERGRELIGEGQWFYDLIRTEYTQGWLEYVGYLPARVTSTYKGYYWPLDLSTLFPQDNLLTQNPWWAFNK